MAKHDFHKFTIKEKIYLTVMIILGIADITLESFGLHDVIPIETANSITIPLLGAFMFFTGLVIFKRVRIVSFLFFGCAVFVLFCYLSAMIIRFR
jgi:hypothetical protein